MSNTIAGYNDYDSPSTSDENPAYKNALKSSSFWSTTPGREEFWAGMPSSESLDPGLYKVTKCSNRGIVLAKTTVITDGIIVVDKDGPMKQVIGEIEKFWSTEVRTAYESRGFLYKRGIMMFGEPGSGKTATVQMLIKKLIERGGIALYAEHADWLADALRVVRRINSEIPIMVVLEDFEILAGRDSDENTWLSVMDGEAQTSNVVFLATTNYLHKLDKRFTDRPSRFDLVVPVYMPSALTRATFLRRKEPEMGVDEIKYWVRETSGFSIAHLKELVISVKVLGKPLTEEVQRMKKMQDRTLDSLPMRDMDEKKVGFGHIPPISPSDREVVDWIEFSREHDL